jgi:zinc D-Ala-D-Ala carboxypeptidase
MKKQSILLTTLFVGFVLGVFYFSGRQEVFAQKASGPERPLVSRTSSSTRTEASRSSAFAAEASANSASRAALAWPFGGKMQRGWEIYVPLISHTIGTEEGAGTTDFAMALSKWQGGKGLPATGVMDDATMTAFVKHWQSQRLGRATTPASDALMSAPIADFWDSGRDANMLQLERETYVAYKRMLAEAAKDLDGQLRFTPDGELAPGEKFLRIVSAFRSPEYQAALRKRAPGAGRAALAKNSPHFTGQALDIYVGGEPVTTKDANRLIQVQTPAYKWLVKNASKFGFYPYFYEPWHWEYVPARLAK